jgi:hypothetical protein
MINSEPGGCMACPFKRKFFSALCDSVSEIFPIACDPWLLTTNSASCVFLIGHGSIDACLIKRRHTE